jgi:hypothetical protein
MEDELAAIAEEEPIQKDSKSCWIKLLLSIFQLQMCAVKPGKQMGVSCFLKPFETGNSSVCSSAVA